MAYVTFVEHKLGTAQAGPASADRREGISARASASPLLAVSLTSRRWPRSRRGLSTPRVNSQHAVDQDTRVLKARWLDPGRVRGGQHD
jgi:hypothetical protein